MAGTNAASRIPVTVTHTTSARAAATNALHGHLWEDFASPTQGSSHPDFNKPKVK